MLKHGLFCYATGGAVPPGSIHPQGWVLVETNIDKITVARYIASVAFTPKGGCLLKQFRSICLKYTSTWFRVAFTPKGGCLLKQIGLGSVELTVW